MQKLKEYLKKTIVIIGYLLSGAIFIVFAYFSLFKGPNSIFHNGRIEDVYRREKNEISSLDQKIVDHYAVIDNELFSLTFPSQPICAEKSELIEGVELISNNCILKENNDTRQYIANWGSYPDSIKSHDPKNVLKQTLDEKIKVTNLKIASQEFLEEKNYFAVKYKTEESDGISADGMIIFSGNTIYDLVFIHYVDDGKTADIFLESFNLK